jgi:hypothetical protein
MQKVNIPEVVTEVKEVFEQYETALQANDADTLDELFWDSPRTVRYAFTRKHYYGHAAISAFRQSRPSVGTDRSVGKTVITTFGWDFATTCREFERDGRHGRQSQSLVRMQEGWRIVAAHVSYMDD